MNDEEVKRYEAKINKLKKQLRDKDVTIDRSMSLNLALARENEKLKKELFSLVSRGYGLDQLSEKREQINKEPWT